MCAYVCQPEGMGGGCTLSARTVRGAGVPHVTVHMQCLRVPTCPVCAVSLWMPRWMMTWSPRRSCGWRAGCWS